jgi:hypothetical protein
MVEVTTSVSGDFADEEIQMIGFVPLGGGDWKAVVTGQVKSDGNLVSLSKEFTAVPAAVKSWLNATGLPMAKTGLKGAL